MNMKEAISLKKGDTIFDSENNPHEFIQLDDAQDLVVKCRPAMGGKIHLYREQCHIRPLYKEQ